MHSINCSVESCLYNKEKVCQANTVNIGEEGATITEATCCKTYSKKSGYNNMAQGASYSEGVESILCSVNTCAYHKEAHCTLKEIEVSSLKDVETYTETDCLSFERQ